MIALILFFIILLIIVLIGLVIFTRFKSLNLLIKNLKQTRDELSGKLENLNTEKIRIAAALSNMAEGVVAIDSKNKITFANPAAEKFFKVLEPDIIGKSPLSGIGNIEIAELFKQAAERKAPINKEIKIYIPADMIFAVQANPIFDEKNNYDGAVCVMHDVTELKRLENYRGDFIANVSHELKTPLTAIRSLVETLISGAINDQAHNRSFLEKIEKHSINLSKLIDDILQISRLEEEDNSGAFKKFNLKNTISQAVEGIVEKAEKKQISLTPIQVTEEIFLSGIEDLIYRAVLNLLENAVNYTEKNGKISISYCKNQNQIEVSVADSGIGIAPEHLARIFERFYRIDSSRSRDAGGTGLGLSIVKHILNLHNGRVEVKSEEGKGSTFTLIFPW